MREVSQLKFLSNNIENLEPSTSAQKTCEYKIIDMISLSGTVIRVMWVVYLVTKMVVLRFTNN